jgi:uncharacterized protein (DUF2147 family)
MKKVFLVAMIAAFSLVAFSQDAGKISGHWLTEKGTSQVYVYKAVNGKYYGKISWLSEPNENGAPKKDTENPEPSLQSTPILNLIILKGFSYNPDDDIWEGGTIYDPDNGKTYDAYMWFEEDSADVLKLKGYVLGMRFLGRETTWKREEPRKMD